MELLKESTTEAFVSLVREVAAECGENVPDMELRLTFVKFGYVMEDIYRHWKMSICRRDSSGCVPIKDESFEGYLLRTVSGRLGRRRTALCWFLAVEREEMMYEFPMYCYCSE